MLNLKWLIIVLTLNISIIGSNCNLNKADKKSNNNNNNNNNKNSKTYDTWSNKWFDPWYKDTNTWYENEAAWYEDKSQLIASEEIQSERIILLSTNQVSYRNKILEIDDFRFFFHQAVWLHFNNHEKVLIQIANEKGVPYEYFEKIYTTITDSYNMIWDSIAQDTYHKKFVILDSVQKKEVKSKFKFSIIDNEISDFR